MSTDPLTMRIELIEKQFAAMMEDKFIQKINSQEKDIQFLKKNALSQEIKISDIETLLNNCLMTHQYKDGCFLMPRDVLGVLPSDMRESHERRFNDVELYRWKLYEKEALRIKEEQKACKENERKKIEDAAQQKKQEEDKAITFNSIKTMMARVALLEETAKKEELEFENLKLVSDMEQLLLREANALARAAKMRSEKANLSKKQKNRASSSNVHTTWSKEKAQQIINMSCE